LNNNGSNVLRRRFEGSAELVARIEAETERESFEIDWVARNSVSLLFCFNLQSVLNLAKEAIGAIQIDNFGTRDQFELSQGMQRLERACFL
jgi:hypothetical protein